MPRCRAWPIGRSAGSSTTPTKFTAREVRRGRRYDGILLDPPKFGRGPEGEVWRLEENLAPLLADCRQLLDANSRFLVLTVYAVRMSALAIGELVKQTLGDLGGTVEMRRDGGARGSARAASADRDLRALVGLSPSRRGSRRRRRTARRRSAAAKPPLRAASARPRRRSPPRRRSAAAPRAAAAASRPAIRRAAGRPSARRPRPPARRGAGVPIASAIPVRAERRAVHAEQGRPGYRGDQQQRREGQPVRGDLGGGDALLGEAVKRELVEHAVGAVGLDQPLDRQQRRGQRGDPQRAGRRSARAAARRARPRTASRPRPAGRRRPAARPRR